jgi:hypothetical protein
MQRRKGKDGELEVVQLARAAGFHDAARTSNGRSQIGRGDIGGIPGVHVEVRRRETWALRAWLDQAEAEAHEHDVPVVAFRRNGGAWYAALPLDELLALLRHREAM